MTAESGNKREDAMRRALHWLLPGLLVVLFLGAAVVLLHAPRETSFRGRRLTGWLQDVTAGTAHGPGSTPQGVIAKASLEAMAPDCFPYMLAMMRANDKRWQLRLDALLAKQDWIRIRLKPRPSHQTRWEAARGFAVLGTNARPAVAKLARLLRDPDTAAQAAFALGSIGTDEAIQALEQALKGKDLVIRQTVIVWMGALGKDGPRLVPALIVCLQDSDAWVREHAARALGAIGALPNLTVPGLSTRLRDHSTDVRRAAAAALGKLGCAARAAEPALQEALREQDPTYEGAVRNALREIAGCEGR